MSRSLWGIPIGLALAMAWLWYVLGADWFRRSCDVDGVEIVGLCIGGPMMLILTITIIGFDLLERRR